MRAHYSFVLLLSFLPPSALALDDAEADRPLERAAWNAALRRDAQGRVLSENRLKALEEACQMPVDPSMQRGPSAAGTSPEGITTFGATRWQPLGPRPAQSLQGWGAVSGRVSAIAMSPSDESTLLIATATGGIWKSTDAGASWRPVSDHAPALAMSHIAYSRSNPSIVYAATGEVDGGGGEGIPNQSLGTYIGAGLLRSSDGGETWSRVDVDLPGNAELSRVLVDPADPQTVLVGIYLYQDIGANGFHSGGIFRSTDGGVHFTQTFTHRISDLAQDPVNPRRVYLAAGKCPECVPSGVYSSNDFGATWTPSLTPATPGAGFTHPTGRIRIGATASGGATILYASVLDSNNEHTTAGLYRSADGGTTWTKKTADPTMCPKAPALNQCFYDHWITPASGSDSTVYFGSIPLFRSDDGGSTWRKFMDPYSTSNPGHVHPDQHFGLVSPTSQSTVYFCTDGGVYRSRDGGASFENLNATLTLAQFNGVAFHPTNPEFAMGGTQDNGNLRYTGTAMWSDRTSSDGGHNLVESDKPQLILSALFFALLNFSANGGDNYSIATACNVLMDCNSANPLETMSFYPPLAAAPAAPGTVFLGTNRLWANTSFGSFALGWKPRSSSAILTTAQDFFTALAIIGDGSGPVWAGSQVEGVFFSPDGGATFSASNNGLPSAVVTSVVAATPDGRNAYVTFGGFLGPPSRHVFRTSDGGASWSNISGNLPDVPILSLAVDPSDPNDLFVGSDAGVFRSANGGASWVSFNEGLPNAGVYSVAFHPATSDLWAATYGRGMFRITAVAVAPAADFTPSSSRPTAGVPLLFVDTSVNAPTSWSWDFGDPGSGPANTSTSENPEHTYAKPGVYTVTLTAANSVGSNQVSHAVTVSAGPPCSRCSRVTPFR